MLETIENLSGKHIVLAGNFDFFFDTSIDSYGGKPTLKKKSITKFIELKKKFDLCDIWRIRGCLHVKFHPGMNLVPGRNHPCRW